MPTACQVEQNKQVVENSEIISTRECAKTQKETASKINTAGSKVEQSCLLSEVEMNRAQKLIQTLSKEFDGIIQITEETKGYTLAKNEFVYNYPNIVENVSGQKMVVRYDPNTDSFEIRNGNVGGKSLFSSMEYKDLLSTQVTCAQSTETNMSLSSSMHGLACCDDKRVTIELTREPKPCKEIKEVVNNYNVLMVLPGMDKNECCFQKVVTPNCRPADNIIRYQDGCYRGHMIHENQRIDYNFPQKEFKPFLKSCGGRLDLSALTNNQFATCTDLPQPMCQLRDQYPQYVTQSPTCGWEMNANQYAICNTYEPTQYNPKQHEYECMSFRNDVFPIAQYQAETNTHQVMIGGEKCHFREQEMVDFLSEYNKDCKEDLSAIATNHPSMVANENHDSRYLEQHVDEKYENKAYKYLLKAKGIEQQAKADYKNTADEQNVKLQSLIDTYDDLMSSCKNPEDRDVKRAKKKLEKYQKKMAKRAKKESEQLQKRLKRAEKYRAKSCDVAQDGLQALNTDRTEKNT
jgi:hypothetical protein